MAKANRARLRIAERSPAPTLRSARPGAPSREPHAPRALAARDSVIEVLSLADEIERAELDPTRIRRLRRRLEHTRPTVASLHRVERVLRHWLSLLDG